MIFAVVWSSPQTGTTLPLKSRQADRRASRRFSQMGADLDYGCKKEQVFP
jgi:hypothetical protein